MINVPFIGKDSWPKRIEDFPEEEQRNYYVSRNNAYTNLIQIEFQLAYHAHISIRDIDDMPSYERRLFFEILQKQKKDEAAAMAEATSKSKIKRR